MIDPNETWTVTVDADLQPLQSELFKAQNYGAAFARSLSGAFESVAFKGKSLGDAIRGIGLSLSKMAFSAAFKPLEQGLASLVNTALSGGLGAFTGGGVAPLPIPFAKGGVIASPVAFPLSGGRSGLAGEAGAEAILPLARGADGRLGVRADGGAGSGVAVTFNITTADADSFRRSETQIAALLARAVGQGQRNL
jgi:phage-related minor tail protein